MTDPPAKVHGYLSETNRQSHLWGSCKQSTITVTALCRFFLDSNRETHSFLAWRNKETLLQYKHKPLLTITREYYKRQWHATVNRSEWHFCSDDETLKLLQQQAVRVTYSRNRTDTHGIAFIRTTQDIHNKEKLLVVPSISINSSINQLIQTQPPLTRLPMEVFFILHSVVVDF